MSERPSPFVLIRTKYGSMIINKNDYHMTSPTRGYGIGFQLINKGEYDEAEMAVSLDLLKSRLTNYGPGVVVVDCGANVGVFTVAWGKALHEVGTVYSFEAQEKLFYALAGNVVLHNCLNVHARHAAVGSEAGTLAIPEPDYNVPASFGSFELKKRDGTEDIGQPIDYQKPSLSIPLVTIDSLALDRLDFLKIDVEGMEIDVLDGALGTIGRCKPQIFVETFKSDAKVITEKLAPLGYTRKYGMGLNTLYLHDSDPLQVEVVEQKESVA